MNEDMTLEFSFGGIASPTDYRDVPFTAAVSVPESVPTTYFPAVTNNLPVWHQRKIGSCVAHAWAKTQQKSEFQETATIVPLSPRFLFALAKSQDGLPGDVGTYPRLVAKILQNQGCATEKTVPNDTTLTFEQYIDLTKIPQSAYDEAKKYKIGGYSFVTINPEEVKRAIYYAGEQRKNIVMLLSIGKEWYTDINGNTTWEATGIIPLRPPKAILGGHEVYPYAYETVNGRLKIWIFNSWSDQWALNGKGWFYWDEYVSFIKEIMVASDVSDDILDQVHQLPDASTFKHNFNTDLNYGMTSDEVVALQTALMIDGEFSKDLYSSLLSNKQLGSYGSITQQAVLVFQRKYNLISLLEWLFLKGRKVGPKTRAKLNDLFNDKT